MKRLLMMTMVVAVVVVLVSSSAQAQFAYVVNPDRYIGHGYGDYARNLPFMTGRSFGGIRYGRGHDRTLNRVTGYGGVALSALQVLSQNSTNDRVLSMAENEQGFRHQQIRSQNNVAKRRPTVRRPRTQKSENQELRQEVEALRLEVERLKLQQELEKAKK